MKKRIAALFLALCTALLTGCGGLLATEVTEETIPTASITIVLDDDAEGKAALEASCPACEGWSEETTVPETEAETDVLTETDAPSDETDETDEAAETDAPTDAPTEAPTTVPEDEPDVPSVEKDGSYTTPEDVAAYIHTFGTLPGNFITKKQAQKLGWVSSEGNLWDVAPGKSIGGDYFGNREGLLPDGDYRECDVNYEGGFRQAERLIYGTDGSVYYTNDHYKTFTQLY